MKSKASNMMRLAWEKLSRDAIPDGGGIADGLKFLSDPQQLLAKAREAQVWATQAVAMVRNAPGDNPYRAMDDEAIAGVVLEQLEKKRAARKQARKQ